MLAFAPNTGTVRVENTTTVSAVDTDGRGQVIAPIPVPAYTSSDTGIATVDYKSGVVTGVTVGTARITARAGSQHDTLTMVVTA